MPLQLALQSGAEQMKLFSKGKVLSFALCLTELDTFIHIYTLICKKYVYIAWLNRRFLIQSVASGPVMAVLT